MPLLPFQYAARISFFQSRLALWTAEATGIGTTSAAVTALSAAVADATTALSDQETKQNAAKGATLALKDALEAMDNLGMIIVEQVRTKARTTPGVYALSNIPEPATPSPRPAPGTPYEPKLILEQDGALTITFKCNNGGNSGTMYQVYRRNGPTEPYAIIGGTGKREFTDETIPAGATQLTYKIQAVRSTRKGAWAEFNVNFGTNAAGVMFAALAATPVKMAA